MKLITAIVNKEDSKNVCNELLKSKFYVTRLATTGGFLMAGNMTLLICTDDGDLLAHLGHNAQVMGDHDDGHAQLVAQVVHQLQDLCLDRHVQRGGRLVGDQQLRLTGQRNGDHNALAHTAGQLVRVLLQAAVRLVDADQLQQLPSAGPSFLLGLFGVQQDDLDDLVADGVHRVQARHRVLEDDGDLVAANFAELLLGHFVDLVAIEPHRAADQPAGVGGQAHDGVGRDRLAGAGLADDAQHVALVHAEGHAVQRLDLARGGEEGQAFVLDFKNFFAHVAPPSLFSS